MVCYKINHVNLENTFLHYYTANLSQTQFSPLEIGEKILITCTMVVDMEELFICRETL